MAGEEAVLTDNDFQTSETEQLSVPATLSDADFAPDVQKAVAGVDAVYDDKRGRAFEVQSGLSGKETEYVIGTGYDKKPTAQHFGLIDLGIDFGENFAKGAGRQIASIPQPFANLVKERGEKGMANAAIDDMTAVYSLSMPMMGQFLQTMKKNGTLNLPRTKMDDTIVAMSDKMIDENKKFVEKLNLKPEQKSNLSQFYFDLGSAGATVAESIGLLMLTKNPYVPAALFGAMSKGDMYSVARAAGKSPEEAGDISTASGIIQTALMGVGGSVFLRAATLDQVLFKTLVRTGEQTVQGMLSTASDEVIKELSGIQNEEWQAIAARIGYSGLLATIAGLPAAAVTSFGERSGVRKQLVSKGVSPKTADQVISMISEKSMNDPVVQERVAAIVNDEFSPVSITLDERVAEFKNVEKAFQEEVQRATAETQEVADKNIAIEKVLKGARLSAKEVAEFPDLADFQFQLDSIDEQIDTVAPGSKEADSLQKRKDALMAPFQELPQGIGAEGAKISKKQVRELTGQIQTGEKMIAESKALKRSMKRQEQAARAASIETKNRIAQAQKYIRAVQKANKAKNVAAEEKVQISQLQELLTKAKTLEELRQLNNKVQELKDRGREKVMASRELKMARRQAQKDILLGTLGFKRDLTGAITVPKQPRLEAMSERSLMKGLRESTIRASRLLDALDGGQDFKGPFHQILYDSLNRSYNYEVALGGEATARGVEILKTNNIKASELTSAMVIDNVPVTMTEAMHIYAAMGNDANRRAVILGNGLTPDFIQKVIGRLPEKFKTAADQIVAELTAHYPRTRAALLDLTDGVKDLPEEKSYIPMRRQEVFREDLETELMAEMDDRSFFRKGLSDPGFTKARREMRGKQSSINLDLVGTYFNHVAKREHFINMQAALKEAKAIIDDADIKEAIRQTAGPEMLTEIEKYVERVHNPYNYLTGDAIEKFSRIMRDRASVVHIGANVLVAAKQLSALPLFLGEVGPWDLIAATTELTHHFNDRVKMIQDLDPQMKYRSIDRSVDEFRKLNPNPKDSAVDKIRDLSFEGVQITDRWVALSGWLAKYNQMRRLGASEAEAVEAAQKAVLRTQNAAAPKDIPSLYATSEFVNLFLQFTNQANQTYNMLTYDIPMRAKMGKPKSALLGALGVATSYLIYYTLAHGHLPEDAEDLTEGAVDSAIDLIPLFGPTVNALRKGYGGTPAAIDTTLKMLKAPFDIPGAVSEGEFGKALDKAAYFAAGAFRLPYTGIRRTIMGLTDLVQGETDDLRRLIYSEAQLGE